jgi:hypothetical protein
MKQRQQKRGKKQQKGEPQRITKAVTHIRLIEANPGKLAALDALAPVYLALCQQYVTLFCTEEKPDKLRTPLYETALSERWHRVAIQQAAGIAKSWRSNRANAYQDYLQEREEYMERQAEDALNPKETEPIWQEWNVPTLSQPCIQANVNVIRLEPSTESMFDYWLIISTLEFRKQLFVPIKLSDYHKEQLTDPATKKHRTINSSVQLNKREDGWWLTLSYDEMITIPNAPEVPVIGIDVGIANFLTTSDGKHYGSFGKKLRKRHKRDREKRRRKAKLRKCLEKKGIAKEKLPSTSSVTGQRLIRHTKQAINRAVNQCFEEHAGCQFAYEQLSVATMRHKARVMNAYVRASNLGHIPQQIEWDALKRGVQATTVMSAYSSQECSVCHYVDRKNRPDQQTFCCKVCGYRTHADLNASRNIAARLHDEELRVCRNRQEIKALLMRRHERWKQHFRITVVDPPVQLGLWACSQASTDVG